MATPFASVSRLVSPPVMTPDDTVAIIGDNRPEWIYAELAAQAAGAKSIGIYQDAVVKEMIYIFTHAHVKFIIVEDQEHLPEAERHESQGGDQCLHGTAPTGG